MKFDNTEYVGDYSINGTEVTIYRKLNKSLGKNASVMTQDIDCGKFGTVEVIYIIVSNIDIKNITDEDKFILLHELGHYYNGDLKKMASFSEPKRKTRILEQEIKADLYAANIVGSEAAIIISKRLLPFFDRERYARIKAIKKANFQKTNTVEIKRVD